MPLLKVSEIGTDASVRFELAPTAIRVNGGGRQFFVRPRWDGKRCRMHLNDSAGSLELWEISQHALSGLFFSSDDR